jgi:hypothetical protein
MSASRRLARLEERIRALGTICRTCHNKGPDLLLAWQAEREGREPVRSCPVCGRPGRFRFDFRELAMKWEDAKALYQRRRARVDAGELPRAAGPQEDLALRLHGAEQAARAPQNWEPASGNEGEEIG